MSAFYSITPTERSIVRDDILQDEKSFVKFWRNDDDTWAAEVGITGVILEGNSPAELLRDIAAVLEDV